jgi:hypothetical protein
MGFSLMMMTTGAYEGNLYARVWTIDNVIDERNNRGDDCLLFWRVPSGMIAIVEANIA